MTKERFTKKVRSERNLLASKEADSRIFLDELAVQAIKANLREIQDLLLELEQRSPPDSRFFQMYFQIMRNTILIWRAVKHGEHQTTKSQ